MKSLIISLFTFLIFSSLVLANPISSFAVNNNNNHNPNNVFRNFCEKHPQFIFCHKDDDHDFCRKNPEKRECHIDVPEFGFIPGAIALLSSGGFFFFLKKRAS